MSLVMEILEELWNTHLHYKGMRVNFFGVPKPWALRHKDHSQKSIQGTFYRLYKNDYIELKSEKWILTKKGGEFFKNKRKLAMKFDSPFKQSDPKNLLLIFDIPETRKIERNWLRFHLKVFKYIMIQKSVWVGPSPLPQKFKKCVKEIGLDQFIKTFKLAKGYKAS